MATTLEKQLEDLKSEILKRRAEVVQLEAAVRDKALSDPESVLAADSRAAAVGRLLPRLESAFREKVAEKVKSDIAEALRSIDERMEKDLVAKSASYPELLEALGAMVNPINRLAGQKDFRRLRLDFDFLSTAPWAELMKNINTVIDGWQKADRAAAINMLSFAKETARQRCETAGWNLIADLAEEPATEGVLS